MRIIVRVKFLILVAWFTIANVSVANAEKTIDLEILKEACESIGFTPKTEPFGNCILKLSERTDLKLIKVDSTKNSIPKKTNHFSKLPSHCSELYGCPPEKYDQEIEAEKRMTEQKERLAQAAIKFEKHCQSLPKSHFKVACKHKYPCSGFKYLCEGIDYSNDYTENSINQNKTTNKLNLSDSGETLEGFFEDLLTIGIVIGGAYLLGTALTPATPPPVGTTNVFTTIIQEAPKYGSPLGY